MKKTLICILVVTVLLGFATLDKSQAASDTLHVLLAPPGDVNNDGTINNRLCIVKKIPDRSKYIDKYFKCRY